ncbi:MAG: TfuA-like protein, partial [Methanoregula sp.]|nr:TfuA-like protein [Methanoregula sp.]
EPLINIRFTLKRALEEGIIDPAAHEILLTAARSLFYPKRTYRAIVSGAGDAVDTRTRDRFLTWVESHACDQKREDAIAALEYIRTVAGEMSGE